MKFVQTIIHFFSYKFSSKKFAKSLTFGFVEFGLLLTFKLFLGMYNNNKIATQGIKVTKIITMQLTLLSGLILENVFPV